MSHKSCSWLQRWGGPVQKRVHWQRGANRGRTWPNRIRDPGCCAQNRQWYSILLLVSPLSLVTALESLDYMYNLIKLFESYLLHFYFDLKSIFAITSETDEKWHLYCVVFNHILRPDYPCWTGLSTFTRSDA